MLVLASVVSNVRPVYAYLLRPAAIGAFLSSLTAALRTLSLVLEFGQTPMRPVLVFLAASCLFLCVFLDSRRIAELDEVDPRNEE